MPADETPKKSCHIWMSHVAYEWVMSHTNESCRIWISHVIYEWVMLYTSAEEVKSQDLHDMTDSYAYEWVMSPEVMSHTWLIHVNTSVMSHIWLIHMWHHFFAASSAGAEEVMSHMNESRKKWCHIYDLDAEEVMSHMNGPCRIWIRHVAYE